MRKQKFLLPVLVSLIFTAAACGGGGGGGDSGPTPPLTVHAEAVYASPNFLVGLAFAPDGRMFVTELQTGAVRVFVNGQLQEQPFVKLPVPTGGIRGLLGIAVDPDFDSNHFVYIYDAVPDLLHNRVIRVRDQDGVGVDPFVVIDNIPAGGHDGGKFAFDTDGHLFVGTGDAGNPAISQELASLGGKVLRLNTDGTIPDDNPFPGNPVFAYGFRNVFGMARHPDSDTIYVSENGPDCNDEVDRLVSGGNFGWRPGQTCDDADPSFIQPVHKITPSTGATGAIFYQGDVFPELRNQLLVAGFNNGEIRRLRVDEDADGAVLEEGIVFPGGSGSINDVAESPNGEIFFTTSGGVFRLVRDGTS